LLALLIAPALLPLHPSIKSVFLHFLREVTYAGENAALLAAGTVVSSSTKLFQLKFIVWPRYTVRAVGEGSQTKLLPVR